MSQHTNQARAGGTGPGRSRSPLSGPGRFHFCRGARSRGRGLTLIEMVVVLVVLVALGAIIVRLFGNLGEDARDQATRATMARVAEAIVGTGGYAEAMRYARDDDDTVFVGYGSGLPWPSPDEVTAGRDDHPQLRYLFVEPTDLLDYDSPNNQFYDPVSRIGWREAWLDVTASTRYTVNTTDGFTDAYGEGDGADGANLDDPAPIDGWGNPVVIQLPDVTAGAVTDAEIEHARLVSAGPDGVLDTPGDVLQPTVAQKGDDLVLYLNREDPNP